MSTDPSKPTPVLEPASAASPAAPEAPPVPEPGPASPLAPAPEVARPSYLLLGGIAFVVWAADMASKVWAVQALSDLPGTGVMVIVEDVLNFALAYNKGGAFSMGASVDDVWRAPFFLIVGIVAVGFIISLYRKVLPEQWTLRFGLPLVLGGALGNLTDRVTRGKVVDFIDYRAGWVETMNSLIAKVQPSWHVTDHWPTFNIADICISVGVGLIALDMFVSGRAPAPSSSVPADRAAPQR
jgi:signal peptidase II